MREATCIAVTSRELRQLIRELPLPAVITKNTLPSIAENFQATKKPGQYLNGYWKGQPKQVEPGLAYGFHFVEHSAVLFIGKYVAALLCDGGRYQLVLDDVISYKIEDFDDAGEAQADLRSILKQNGAVIYSYFLEGKDVNSGFIETKGNDQVLEPEAVVAKLALQELRPEQRLFRNRVFLKHGARCVVTGCAIEVLLDAAHLRGRDWRKGHNHADDGIPLRADLHRAYDAGLIDIDPVSKSARWAQAGGMDSLAYGEIQIL
jgi:hypothetical protein